jgi:uncharacterized membrane protein
MLATYTPFHSRASREGAACALQRNPLEGAFGPVNVGDVERYGSLLGGAALVAAGLSRRSLPGLLLAGLGGLFMMRGAGGHCRLYDSIGVSTAGDPPAVIPGNPALD